jgi:hypothetical protein
MNLFLPECSNLKYKARKRLIQKLAGFIIVFFSFGFSGKMDFKTSILVGQNSSKVLMQL